MKLLLFSDLHTDTHAARRLVERSFQVDVLVGAGDFATVRRNLNTCLDVLHQVALPIVLVAGNNETTEELIDACRDWPNAHILHGSSVTIQDVPFFGIGGGVPVTPFGAWSYDFTEEQAEALLASCPTRCVLTSHSPPKGVLDMDSNGRSLGSVAVRDAIVRTKPLLVVCGHIHASSGQHAMLGDTPVINAGPAGVVWELASGKTIK